MKIKLSFNYHLIYAILDVLLSFGVVTLSLVSVYGFHWYGERLLANLLYAGGISFLTLLVFLFFKI